MTAAADRCTCGYAYGHRRLSTTCPVDGAANRQALADLRLRELAARLGRQPTPLEVLADALADVLFASRSPT